MIILGIETSCDETAAALYATQQGILSNVLVSQIDIHQAYGGVVPELASRSHIACIHHIVAQALNEISLTTDAIDAVAVTTKPGLPGSLLVGLCFAKGFAYAKDRPIIGVDHLEGHIFSPFLEQEVPFPHLCLSASGGHTALYFVENFGQYTTIGHTVDDAAGEAFDKIAKLLHLPYPGGPIIEQLAQQANFENFFHYPRLKGGTLNFSFSGLKTAVLYDLIKRGAYDLSLKRYLGDDQLKKQVASSLLVCIADIFEQRLLQAFNRYPQVQAFTFVGGVACNEYIKGRLKQLAITRGIHLYVPSKAYCTDNAGMIAFVGHYKAHQGLYNEFSLDIF